EILTRQMLGWEAIPRATQSVPQALEWLHRSDVFDLAIFDMQMPYLDGVSLADHVRSLPLYRTLPLVMLSSIGSQLAIENRSLHYFSAVLDKPIKQAQLRAALVEALNSMATVMLTPPENPSPPQPERAPAPAPLRILVAEDLALNQEVALQALASLGYQADIANNGREAVEAVRATSYNIVFLDVQMPMMDGLTAARIIREESASPQHPWLIAMTAHAMRSDRDACLQAGMNDYLSKPVRLKTLNTALETYRATIATAMESPESPPSNASTQPASLSASPARPSPLDARILQEFCDAAGDRGDEMVAKIVQSYLRDAPQRLAAIRNAADIGDAVGVQQAAHALKSLSASIGATAVAQQCEVLEVMGRTGVTAGIQAIVTELNREFEQAIAALESNAYKNDSFSPFVLIVDDEETIRTMISATLTGEGYRVATVTDSRACLAQCQQQIPDIILLDALMPGMDGFACCRELRATWSDRCPPILMITGLNDDTSVDRAFAAGADDYTTKPIHWPVLRQRVRRLLQNRWAMAELEHKAEREGVLAGKLEAANRELQRLASTDSLTLVANRRVCDEYLQQEWRRLARLQDSLAIAICDVDAFKAYNDAYGHPTGDECLRQVATILNQTLKRPADLFARFGGEEFLAILPHTDANGAVHVADAMRNALREAAIPHDYSPAGSHVTMSMGVAAIVPHANSSVIDLVEAADRALYRAKEEGRDRVVSAGNLDSSDDPLAGQSISARPPSRHIST
ncbi:MAG: response regulator, partial [Cyanobacteria bacterium J06648_11]